MRPDQSFRCDRKWPTRRLARHLLDPGSGATPAFCRHCSCTEVIDNHEWEVGFVVDEICGEPDEVFTRDWASHSFPDGDGTKMTGAGQVDG